MNRYLKLTSMNILRKGHGIGSRSGARVLRERKPFSQVDPTNLGISTQLLRRSCHEYSAFVDNVGPVCHGKGLTNIMVCNQHTDSACFQVKNDLLQIEYRNGIYSRKGLVKKDEGRLDAKTPRNLHPPAFAPRQRITARLANMSKIKLIDEFFRTAPAHLP